MAHETLSLDYPACLAGAFPEQLPGAIAAVEDVLAASRGARFDSLVERSPGLRDNDWANYLRCSIVRMVHAARALQRCGLVGGRVLDYGAYFGNFALMLQRRGYSVDAVDAYDAYGAAFPAITSLLSRSGIAVHDFQQTGRDLAAFPPDMFDAVLCMGVVEHIPHTPRYLLEALDRVLAPGGLLLLETPNVAHLYNRQRLARGEPIMTPLPAQYYAAIPFEGHHREYTPGEAFWMAQQLGHRVEMTALYNYSVYEQKELTGRDVTNYLSMQASAELREVVLVVSRKPRPGETFVPSADWKASLIDEGAADGRAASGDQSPDLEALAVIEPLLLDMHGQLVDLQEQLGIRDRMLREAEEAHVAGILERDRQVRYRDDLLAGLQDTANAYAKQVTALDLRIAQLDRRRIRRAVKWVLNAFKRSSTP